MTHPIEQHETVALLDGRYQLYERVGEGGMAEVHRAEDVILGRTVAIKLLKNDAEVLASPVRAHREVSALARLNHPSLVTLLEARCTPRLGSIAVEHQGQPRGIQVCYWATGRGELLRVELETVPDRGETVTLPSIDFTGRVLQRDFATTAGGNEELLIQLDPAGSADPSRWEQGRRARASRQSLRRPPPPPHWGQTAPEEEAMAAGTSADPWVLRTAPGTSEYTMYRDGDELVCQVGSTRLTYQARAIDDLHTWLVEQGDWVPLGAADEQKPAADGTVEAWGRSDANPVGGWYGTRKGYRGRFGMYLPPLLEELGMVELEHNPRSNRVRALPPR